MARVTLTDSHGDKCASDGCSKVAVVHFECGDVGSDYCSDCIDAIRRRHEKDAPKCVGCRMPLVDGISIFKKFGPPTPERQQGYWHMLCHQRMLRLPEPKPCPVCGRKPDIERCAPWPTDMGPAPWYAGCYDPGHREHFRGVNGDTKADAIDQWNKIDH